GRRAALVDAQGRLHRTPSHGVLLRRHREARPRCERPVLAREGPRPARARAATERRRPKRIAASTSRGSWSLPPPRGRKRWAGRRPMSLSVRMVLGPELLALGRARPQPGRRARRRGRALLIHSRGMAACRAWRARRTRGESRRTADDREGRGGRLAASGTVERRIWVDGELVPWERAGVHVLSHSLQRGSLVFDYMSVHETPRGAAVFRLREHVERFLVSVGLVGLPLAHSREEIEAAILATVRANPGARAVKVCAYLPSIEVDVVPMDERTALA